MTVLQQFRYTLAAVTSHAFPHAHKCPYCSAGAHDIVGRKKFVTKLVRCRNCKLLYRVPTEPTDSCPEFYDTHYSSGLTTQLPDADELKRLVATSFRGTEKDFSKKIEFLQAVGVQPGMKILDFGASWGYGTWQLREAGYDAVGYEISKTRATYAVRHLQVKMEHDIAAVTKQGQTFDAILGVHVFEHLPSPRLILDVAHSCLKPGGLLIGYTPNGSKECMLRHPKLYHHSWGRLHPLYWDREFLVGQFSQHPKLLLSKPYGQQCDLIQVQQWTKRSNLILDLSERELVFAIVF